MRSFFALLVCLIAGGIPSVIGSGNSPSRLPNVAERKERAFELVIFRRVGVVQQYVPVCNANDADSHTSSAIGRAFMNAPEDRAKDRAFLRCLIKKKSSLTEKCMKGRKQFEHAANAALEECAHAEPVNEDGGADPRAFSQDNCSVRFTSYVGRNVWSLWSCQCYQQDYTVLPGVAIFSTEMSPIDSALENEILQQCTASTKDQLDAVCKNVPNDFQLLALHILQACCKRARTATDAKLQCAEAVPADVSPFKFLSLFED